VPASTGRTAPAADSPPAVPTPSARLEDTATALEAALAAAKDTGAEPLAAVAAAYRAFALDHSHLYQLMNDRPLPREALPEGVEARAAAPLLRVAGSQDLARAVWAFAHGMVQLELAGRFPSGADLDPAWEAGITALQARVAAQDSKTITWNAGHDMRAFRDAQWQATGPPESTIAPDSDTNSQS
jgi:Tetracyclin repressor-like, C-terminal domain